MQSIDFSLSISFAGIAYAMNYLMTDDSVTPNDTDVNFYSDNFQLDGESTTLGYDHQIEEEEESKNYGNGDKIDTFYCKSSVQYILKNITHVELKKHSLGS